VPDKDVRIVFTGLRPGEKLDEELTSNIEATMPTPVDKIRLVNTAEVDGETLRSGLDRLDALLPIGTDREVLEAIRAIVPEYASPAAPPAAAEIEVPLGSVGIAHAPRRALARNVEAPGSAAAPVPLDAGVAAPINIARAS